MKHPFHKPTWILLLILATVALFPRCQKQHLPDPTTGDPVFGFSGTVGSDAYAWQAGNDGRYQHTTFSTGSSGLYVFEGTLGDKDCPECGPALRILLYDSQVRTPANPLVPDSVVVAGLRPLINFAFSVNRGLALSLQPLLMNFGPRLSYTWSFGDGTFSTDPSPVKVYQQPGQYQVCLTAIDSTMQQDSLCNQFTITGQPRQCDALFTFQHLGGNSVEFRPAIIDPGTKYRWNFGDETASGMPVTRKTFSGNTIYRVCLEAVKGDCIDQFCMRVPIPDSFGSVANYTYAFTLDTMANRAGRAEVQWIDMQGRMYSSLRANAQPSGSRIEFSNIEAYDRNGSGQATRKFGFDTEVWVYRVDDQKDSLKLKGSGTFAVAYPD
jgi:hypothetical protein